MTEKCPTCGRSEAPAAAILRALRELPGGTQTPTTISEYVGRDRRNVSQVLDRLERDRVIRWRRDANGRRITGAVTITGRSK